MIPLELWQAKFDSVYGPGEIIFGSDMSNEQAMQYAFDRFHEDKYCIVREWVWADLAVSDDLRQELLEKHQLQPTIVHANSVVFDSEARFEPGNWVRTTMLHSFRDGFLFQTKNTTYLLLGMGYRKGTRETLT